MRVGFQDTLDDRRVLDQVRYGDAVIYRIVIVIPAAHFQDTVFDQFPLVLFECVRVNLDHRVLPRIPTHGVLRMSAKQERLRHVRCVRPEPSRAIYDAEYQLILCLGEARKPMTLDVQCCGLVVWQTIFRKRTNKLLTVRC